MGNKCHKYLSIFKLAALHALKNIKALIGLSIFLITCLVIFAHLWKVAAAKAGVVHFNPEQLLWYIAFNEWILVSLPDVQFEMEEDLRSGRLSYLLPRPISYLGAVFAEAFGTLCINLICLGAVTVLFTWGAVGVLPFQPMGFILAIIFGLMAGCLSLLLQMIIGLSAFWLQEVSPVSWIFEKSMFLLGGLILPLTVYPQWIQTLASFTPFPAILGGRSAMALDFNFSALLSLTLSLTIWTMISLLALILLYRRGQRILNIEGG